MYVIQPNNNMHIKYQFKELKPMLFNYLVLDLNFEYQSTYLSLI
jgi:hypothetical protein